MSALRRIAIIGANAAGLSTALGLRARGYDGQIDLIDTDPDALVQRPPLSKSVLEGAAAPPLVTHSELEAARLQLHLGRRAVHIDRTDGSVLLDDNRSLRPDALVLATGSAAIIPRLEGITLPGVLTLRTLADAALLAEALRPGARLVIIGGGVIGAEVASTAQSLGCEVTLVEAASELMIRSFGYVVGGLLRERHVMNGVDVRMSRRAVRLVGSKRLSAVELDDGSVLPADAALIAVGAAAQDSLAIEAGIASRNGIFVNASGQTSIPSIWAVGDAARYTDGPYTGMRLEHQHAAESGGRRLASAILGYPGEPWELSYFWSDQLGGNIQVAGQLPSDHEPLFRGDRNGPSFTAFFARERRLAAVVSFNGGRDFAAARRLIGAEREIDPKRLADPNQPLRELLAEASTAPA